MKEREYMMCSHEIDDSTKKFVERKGFVGKCKKCGTPLIQARIASVEPRDRPHMSKKQRLKERRKESLKWNTI